MTTAAAIFVKTPGCSPLKTRLARDVGRTDAEHFHVLAARCVADVVRAAAALRPVQPVWAIAEPEALGHPLWSAPGFAHIGQGSGGLGERIASVCEGLFAGYDSVLLLGADCPQITVDLVVDAVDRLACGGPDDPPACVLGRARDGGFWLWGSRRRPESSLWTRIPWSAADTADRLVAELAAAGGTVDELSTLSDADTLDDLRAVLDELPAQGRMLPSQRDLRCWLQAVLRD